MAIESSITAFQGYNAIGLVELNCIAKGLEAADAMLKAAHVRLINAYPICPGKYIVLVAGEVAAVKASVDLGLSAGTSAIVDYLIIPNIHPQVFPAIMGTTAVEKIAALGTIETYSLASCIIAADAAVKAADVTLIEVRLGRALGGKAFVTMTGEVAAVKSAVDAGLKSLKEDGLVCGYSIIPSPHPDLTPTLF